MRESSEGGKGGDGGGGRGEGEESTSQVHPFVVRRALRRVKEVGVTQQTPVRPLPPPWAAINSRLLAPAHGRESVHVALTKSLHL